MDYKRISITGSRNLEGQDELVDYWFLRALDQYKIIPIYLKEGGAKGFDTIVRNICAKYFNISKENGNLETLKPVYRKDMTFWERKKAPLERNGDIVADTDVCIAGFNGTDRTKGGTMDAVKKAIKLNIPVILIDFPNQKIEYLVDNPKLF